MSWRECYEKFKKYDRECVNPQTYIVLKQAGMIRFIEKTRVFYGNIDGEFYEIGKYYDLVLTVGKTLKKNYRDMTKEALWNGVKELVVQTYFEMLLVEELNEPI